MKPTQRLLLVLTLCFVPACSTTGRTTLLGMGLGLATGAAIGTAADAGPKARYRTQNVAIGSAIGSVLGAIVAFLFHPNEAQRPISGTNVPAPAAISDPLTQPNGLTTPPIMTPPKVETHFVDDEVVGNKFIPGHFEYQIVEPPKWNN